jgi:hypothetical protein
MDRDWSAKLVKDELVRAFIQNKGVAVSSPIMCDLRPCLLGQRLAGRDLLGLTWSVLGRDSDERVALIHWAAATAYGRNIADEYRRLGWSDEKFYARLEAGAKAVATAILRLHHLSERCLETA